MPDTFIYLPDGSFIRPSHILVIQVRQPRPPNPACGFPALIAGVVIITRTGGHMVLDFPTLDEAKKEALRIAQCCDANYDE